MVTKPLETAWGVLVTIGLLLSLFVNASCNPSGLTFECQNGLCIDINLTEPVQALQPVEFTIRVKAETEINNLGLIIYSYQGVLPYINEKPEGAELIFQSSQSMTWVFNAKGGENYLFSGNVIFPKPPSSIRFIDYDIVVTAAIPGGARVTDSISVNLDPNGNQIDSEQVKILMETDLPIPTMPPDMTIVVHTPRPSITPPQDTPIPTPTSTDIPYPPPGG